MSAQRLVIPSTAFSVAKTKQKRPRIKDDAHLDFIRQLPCCICGAEGVEAAHIRAAAPMYGKRETGGAEKASDKWTTPLCPPHHREQHSMNELKWWASKRVDPFGLALSLYAFSGDYEIAESIINARMPR